MPRGPVASYAEMHALNRDFNAADYVTYVIQWAELGTDFVHALVAVLNPRLIEREGKILVEPVGAVARYETYRAQGQSPDEAEYWANLTLVSDLTAELEVDEARKLAQVLLWTWQNVLSAQFPRATQVVRMLEDRTEGEIFVTLAEPGAP